jgi:NTE family protein
MLGFKRRSGPPAPAEPWGTAFVLSGGANLGAAQVGGLLGLFDAGIVPDMVVGCSVGALNGAYVAADPTLDQAEALADIWRSLSASAVFDTGRLRALANVVRRQDHVYEADGLRGLIRRLAPVADLSDTKIPMHVVTTDLDAGAPAWFSAGHAEDVLAASAALPGLFPPVEIEGHLHVDGGVLEPVPVRQALRLGCRTTYVLDVSTGRQTGGAEPRRPRSALDVLIRSFEVARARHMPDPRSFAVPGQAVIVVPLADTTGLDMRDFSQTDRLITESRAIARRYLTRTTRTAA